MYHNRSDDIILGYSGDRRCDTAGLEGRSWNHAPRSTADTNRGKGMGLSLSLQGPEALGHLAPSLV